MKQIGRGSFFRFYTSETKRGIFVNVEFTYAVESAWHFKLNLLPSLSVCSELKITARAQYIYIFVLLIQHTI